jgi:hypothetical protein
MAKTKTSKAKKADYVIEADGLTWIDPTGGAWSPVACGEHRSIAPHEFSTDDEDEAPKGYQQSCEECVAELASTVDQYNRSSHIEPGASAEERRKVRA